VHPATTLTCTFVLITTSEFELPLAYELVSSFMSAGLKVSFRGIYPREVRICHTVIADIERCCLKIAFAII
jgi:hypothetical protein